MTDQLLAGWVSGLIELTKAQWMLGHGKRWKPGERLQILLPGYNGTRNTGADVLVLGLTEYLRGVRILRTFRAGAIQSIAS